MKKGLNRAKKNKILSKVCMIKKGPHSTVYLRRDEEKYVLKAGLHATCKVNSSNTKNPASFFILASLLDKGLSWRMCFLKVYFGIIQSSSLSNGATANANTKHEYVHLFSRPNLL